MKGMCYFVVLLLFVCANVMYFVGYECVRACHPHISTSTECAQRAYTQGSYLECYAHPNMVLGIP